MCITRGKKDFFGRDRFVICVYIYFLIISKNNIAIYALVPNYLYHKSIIFQLIYCHSLDHGNTTTYILLFFNQTNCIFSYPGKEKHIWIRTINILQADSERNIFAFFTGKRILLIVCEPVIIEEDQKAVIKENFMDISLCPRGSN